MTEVPPHLLERSRLARQRMTGEGGDAPAGDGAAASAAATPAVASSAPAVKAPVEIIEAPPVIPSPMVVAAEARPKIPFWVVPVLIFLPIWGLMYAGTLERPPATGGLAFEGPIVYAANCAGCHGGGGGGGSGRALNGGAVVETFPDALGQIWWVANGSPASGVPYGNPNRLDGQRTSLSFNGNPMAGWAGSLSAEELVSAVYYERIEHGGQNADELEWMVEWVESAEFPEAFEGEYELPASEAEAIELLRLWTEEFNHEEEVAAG